MPRIARVKKSIEEIYHVMERGNEKKEIFRDDEDRIKFLDIINSNQVRYGFSIYAYCLMNNHVHLLVGCNGCDISQLMKSINISYAIFFNRKYQRCGHLFQDRFKSELIDNDAYAIEVSRYIHLNSVRAGMIDIDDIGQYPWSSYNQYIGSKSSHLSVDTNFILGMFSNMLQEARIQYRSYLMRDDDNKLIEGNDMPTALVKPHVATSEYNYDNDPQKILKAVAAEYGVDWADSKRIAISIRNEMIIKVRRKSQLSLKVIGEMFGGLSESAISKILKNS